jgi:hypothetical protein
MRRLLQPVFVGASLLSLTAALAQAGGSMPFPAAMPAAGVKEALAKGADYAVASLGKTMASSATTR